MKRIAFLFLVFLSFIFSFPLSKGYSIELRPDGSEIVYDSQFRIETDCTLIHSLLSTHYREILNFTDTKSKLKYYLDSFNSSCSSVYSCWLRMGYDKYPCIDKFSCFADCQSSEYCKDFASRKNFVNLSMFLYEQTSILLDSLNSCYSIINSADDVSDLTNLEVCLNRIYNAAKEYSSSPIAGEDNRSLGICSYPDFDYSSIEKAQELVRFLHLALNISVDERTNSICSPSLSKDKLVLLKTEIIKSRRALESLDTLISSVPKGFDANVFERRLDGFNGRFSTLFDDSKDPKDFEKLTLDINQEVFQLSVFVDCAISLKANCPEYLSSSEKIPIENACKLLHSCQNPKEVEEENPQEILLLILSLLFLFLLFLATVLFVFFRKFKKIKPKEVDQVMKSHEKEVKKKRIHKAHHKKVKAHRKSKKHHSSRGGKND